MKKFTFILSFILLLSVLTFSVSAEANYVTPQASSGVDNMSSWQIAVTAIIMFTVISIIGVMFLKIVIKNKNERR